MVTQAVVVDHLTKHFGEVLAVNDISFEILEGEIFGIHSSGNNSCLTFPKVTPFISRIVASSLMSLINPPTYFLWNQNMYCSLVITEIILYYIHFLSVTTSISLSFFV